MYMYTENTLPNKVIPYNNINIYVYVGGSIAVTLVTRW